jgi:hypothetical protein
MNILYLGHYREKNSFGYASLRYIEALNNIANVNLSIRPIYLTIDNYVTNLDKDLLSLENNKQYNYDCVIQDTLPEFYEYNNRFGKNICVPKIATRNLSHTGWIEKINMMDEVWVNSFYGEKILRESGVFKKIKVIPEPFNLKRIDEETNHSDENEFNFYSFSSLNHKDGLLELLIAYLSEFSNKESARLIIKIDSAEEGAVKNIVNNAYEISRKTPKDTIEPIIILGHIDHTKKVDLHNNCHCYIDTSKCSHGGAACVEALLYGNSVICVDKTAPACYITQNNGFNIKSIEENVISNNIFGLNNVFTQHEVWYKPIVSDIRAKMRSAFQLTEQEKQRKMSSVDRNIFDNSKFHTYL